MHKLVYESLMRIFITQMKANLSDTEDLNAFGFQIRKSIESSNGDSFEAFLLAMIFVMYLTWSSNARSIYHLDQCKISRYLISKWWSSY